MNYNKIDKEENERNIEHKDLRGSVRKPTSTVGRRTWLYSLITKILQVKNNPPPQYDI